ncbi:MAG: hypothetical protein ACFB22_05825 [Rhodothalassiaceae bacterium]
MSELGLACLARVRFARTAEDALLPGRVRRFTTGQADASCKEQPHRQ